MADKKLNAVSTASDGAYVYAEDASGNQIKISKADLATVVAGMITNEGLNVLYQSKNPTDFNSCKNTGVYVCGGADASHGPTSNPYGTLIVFASTSILEYSIQLFIARGSTPNIYYRIFNGDWVALL